MKKEATFYIYILLASLLLITSCQLDKFDMSDLSEEKEIGQSWAAPLVKGELTTKDLLETFDSTGVINSDADGLLYLVYTDSLYSVEAKDTVNLPDQDYFDLLYKVPTTINNFNDTTNVSKDTMHRITYEDEEQLDSIITDQFTLIQHVSTDIQNDIELTITYTDIVKNGQPLEDNINISAGDVPYDEELTNDLNGYTIRTFQPDTSDHKYFRVHYELTINGTGNDLNEDEEISIATMIENVDMQSAYGYIGQETLMQEEGSIPIELFGETQEGTVEFAEPEFKFLIENSYGVPIQIELKDAKAYREGSTDSTDITFENSSNIFDINYPKFSENEIGETKEETINISDSICNLSEALATNPTHIKFTSQGMSNPDGNLDDLDYYNFVTDKSQFNVLSELYLPLHLRAEGLSLRDTVDLDMSDLIGEDQEEIKEVITKFKTLNGLPADVDFQVYFLDSTYQMVDTLFNEDDRPVIKSASTDNAGKVTTLTEKLSEMSFDENEISDLERVRNAVFEASMKTSDFSTDPDKKVKFYSDYTFKFRMNIETKLNLNLNK
ncbi:MAG: hypothetical protein ACQESJ_06060 [Bacteroidota bacterium]